MSEEQLEGVGQEKRQAEPMLPHGVWVAPAGCGMLRGGRFCALDQGLAALTGYTASELFELPWRTLWADVESAPAEPNPESLPCEAVAARLRRKDGLVVEIVFSAVPLVGDGAQAAEVALTVFDAAVLNRMERQRTGLAAELDRTRQQLIRAARLSAIGSLVAAVAHQLNNPLCGVLGLIERLARKPDLPTAESGLLALAVEQCKRMKQLIRELQRSAAPVPEARGVFDLHQTLDGVLQLLNKHLNMAKVRVRKEYGPGPMAMTGVEPQIRQALLGLIKTSGEALPESGELRIQTGREGDRVRIVLGWADCGLGDQALAQLAGAGCSADRASGMADQEAQMGLSVACGIVKAHGGEIRVASTSARETTMTVLLPIDDREGNREWNTQQF